MDIIDNAQSGICPLGLFEKAAAGPLPIGVIRIDLLDVHRALWREFHAAPRKGFLAFLSAFIPRVPCGDCREGFAKLVAENPPPLDTDESLFAWTVAMHNAVNRKLGKPEMTVEEARRIHS
jgi:hypothetical protein